MKRTEIQPTDGLPILTNDGALIHFHGTADKALYLVEELECSLPTRSQINRLYVPLHNYIDLGI